MEEAWNLGDLLLVLWVCEAAQGFCSPLTSWIATFSLLVISGTGTFLHTLIQMYEADHSISMIVGLGTYPSLVMAFGRSES